MHPKHGLSAALIGTSIALIASYNQTANALTAPEVAKIAKQVTVRIEYQVKGEKRQGSGFIVKKTDETYYVVTAYHVVSAETKYTLITPDGERYNLDSNKISYKSGTDLSVVQFTSSKTYQIAKIGNSDSAPEGSTVYVAGFPARTSAVSSSELYRFLKGEVSANASQPLDEGYSLVYTNPTLGGMSGGPVLNEQGEVIAIHGKAETQAQSTTDGVKAISTGNNLGISVNTFLRLALLDTGVKAPVQVAAAPKADDFYLKGVDLEEKKDYRGAIEEYNKALDINPKYGKAYFGRGNVHKELKDYPKALADYSKTIAIDPKYAAAYNNRGIVHKQLKDYPKAVADYNQAIAIDPKLALAYGNRGIVRAELKDYPKALADFNQVLAIDPKSALAYYNRGIVHKELKEYPKALADYNQAIAIDPKDPKAYGNRGLVRYELKDYPKAIADFNQAIALDPKDAGAYNNRGLVHYELPKKDAAISDWRKARDLGIQSPALKLSLGVALYTKGEEDKGLRLWKEGVELLGFVPNLQQLKVGGWGNVWLQDAAKLLKDPRL
jgi:tetratricopeptide (TPR) repeat protein/V8-like Glu-specific endopeptidase